MFSFISAIPLVWKLVACAVFAAALIGAYWLWHNAVYERGFDKAVSTITKLDRAAFDRYIEGQRLIDACRAQGKEWNVETGTCQ